MEHRMKLRNDPFQRIKAGKKTVELRLYDEKRRLVKISDTIVFTNIDTEETVKVEVTKLKIFKDFKALFDAYDPLRFGHDEKVDPDRMSEYYSEEDIRKYNVIAIEIRKI